MAFSVLNSRLKRTLFLLLISIFVKLLWMDEEDENRGIIMLPYAFRGIVVYGFGRGGKQLKCPTG